MPLGLGVDGDVNALAVCGANLYVGGEFTQAGGVPARGIAKWDGSSWSALGYGIYGPSHDGEGLYVAALAVKGTQLLAGGLFSGAGVTLSPAIVQANLVINGRFENVAYSALCGFTCTFNDAIPGQVYRIQTSSASNTWSDLTNFIYSGPVTIAAPAVAGATNCFYRAVGQ